MSQLAHKGGVRRILSFDMGTRSMAFAVVRPPCTIERWGIIDLVKHQARQATDTLLDMLEGEHRWMREADDLDVVVELQPGNGVCKTLSHVMQAYFRLCDQEDGRSRLFVFMQAGNKLKYAPDICAAVHPSTKDERKRVTMLTTERILEQNARKFTDFYRAQPYKQRTDLADALVQGCRFLQIQNS